MSIIVLQDTDVEILYADIPAGEPLVWIIDGDCLYDLPVKNEYVNMFLNSDTIEDVSENYAYHNGIAVRFKKESQFIYDYLTSEYFGSILLSEPQVINLKDYPYGRYVMSPHAKFDGSKFIILDQDVSEMIP